MAINKAPAQETTNTPSPHRRSFLTYGLALRVLLALIIGWLILMAFFVTNVASH